MASAVQSIQETAVVRCGWLLDGSGTPARPDMLLRIDGGRIVEIRPAGGAVVEAVNWGAWTVLPLLVDAHVHLFLSGRNDPALRQRQLGADMDAAVESMLRRVRRHLRRGVLAVRDGGDANELVRRLPAAAAERWPAGFVLRTAGRAWHQAGRYGRIFGRAPDPGRSLAEAVAAGDDGIDHVKIIHSGINALTRFGAPNRPQFGFAELKGAVTAAHRRGLSVMVHANGPVPVAEALAAGCDSIEHGFFMGEANLERMATQGTTWVPTVGTMAGYAKYLPPGSLEADGARRHLDHQLDQLARARSLGVTVALGTDAGCLGVRHGRGMRVEMALMQAAGYRLEEVIRCGAVNGARLLRLERNGELRPGAAADFVLTAGAPADLPGSLGQVAAVYLGGRAVYLG